MELITTRIKKKESDRQAQQHCWCNLTDYYELQAEWRVNSLVAVREQAAVSLLSEWYQCIL